MRPQLFNRSMNPYFSKFAKLVIGLRIFVLLACACSAFAQQQQQGLCARVKIVILQELALERVGFEATLEITNNDGEDPITDFSAALTFENPQLTTNAVNDSSSLFFVRAPTFESINGVNGDGVISPSTKAVIRCSVSKEWTSSAWSSCSVFWIGEWSRAP